MSLSASDGSAFITKGEFDSSMAEINIRLTIFEAGINSKIESQISNYLDRNGIKVIVDKEIERYLKINNVCRNGKLSGIISYLKNIIFN